MIIIGNIKEIDTEIETYKGEYIKIDKCYSIVRNNKNINIENLIEISPSEELYSYYLNKKKKFEWNKEIFNKYFAIKYINELKNNPKSIETIKWLSNSSENIFLGCFCENELLCHRIILGGILSHYTKVESIVNNICEFKHYFIGI